MSVAPDPKLAKYNQPLSPTPDGVATPTNGSPTLPPGKPQQVSAEDFALTDGVAMLADRVPGDVLDRAMKLVDRRASVRITSDRIELHGVTGTRRIPLDKIKGIELSTRKGVMDQLVPYWRSLLSFVPAARFGKLVRLATFAVARTKSDPEPVDPTQLDQPIVARLKLVGGRKIKIRGSIALVAVLYPRLTARLLEEADRHGIPVVAYA